MSEKTLTLATKNKHKIEKLTWIVEGFFDDIKQLDKDVEIDETEGSFVGNAEKKALAVSKLYGTYAIATDGGVLIPSLGSNWNELLTRRFAGEDVSDEQRIKAILDLMKDKYGKERRIEWHEAIALAHNGKVLFSKEVEGDWGLLQIDYDMKQYKEGIWLCTLWSYPQFGNKNFFDLTNKEKEYAEISWFRLKEESQKFLKSCSVK